MQNTGDYWAAYERLKRIDPIPGFDASKRMTRERVHERHSAEAAVAGEEALRKLEEAKREGPLQGE